MEIIREIPLMRSYSERYLHKGRRVGLVPTMGSLHQGHLSLFDELRKGGCDVLGASIFVNPIQFGAGEDYDKYPRAESTDFTLLEEIGCDFVFCPVADDLFPRGFQSYIDVQELSKHLCGKYRAGHFRGVATIVMKLFTIVRPTAAAFGLKDYQQALIINQMVRDLNIDVELRFGQTIREDDGLAMSSRNRYLSSSDRMAATSIPQSLEWARQYCKDRIRSSMEIIDGVRRILKQFGEITIQYVEVVDPETLEPVEEVSERALLAIAVYIGKTRLIDNAIIGTDRKDELFGM